MENSPYRVRSVASRPGHDRAGQRDRAEKLISCEWACYGASRIEGGGKEKIMTKENGLV